MMCVLRRLFVHLMLSLFDMDPTRVLQNGSMFMSSILYSLDVISIPMNAELSRVYGAIPPFNGSLYTRTNFPLLNGDLQSTRMRKHYKQRYADVCPSSYLHDVTEAGIETKISEVGIKPIPGTCDHVKIDCSLMSPSKSSCHLN